MNSAADWIVVAGFLLAVTGLALRIVIMMRASDANPATAPPLAGRDLIRADRASRPTSRLPLVMWASIAAGSILLIAGMLLEFR